MRLISDFLQDYEKQQKVISKNVIYLSQNATNVSIEDCWNMSSHERDLLLEVIKEISKEREKAMKRS